MRRRLQLLVVIAAWLVATGSQWDFVQVIAWGRMIYTYSRVMPVAEGVRITFTSGQMCSLCRAVNEAGKTDSAVPQFKAGDKVILFCQAPVQPVVVAPGCESWAPTTEWVVTAELAPPPVPPPRFAAA